MLIELVRHHVEDEEGEMFPAVRAAVGRKALTELGDVMEKAKAISPKQPHPKAPDTPPGNLVAGPGAAAGDRVKAVAKKGLRPPSAASRSVRPVAVAGSGGRR